MPFKSLAQEGYLHEHPEILGKSGLKEWDQATKGKHLPQHAKHGYTHTHIEHHHDGSHTVAHHHVPAGEVGDARSPGSGWCSGFPGTASCRTSAPPGGGTGIPIRRGDVKWLAPKCT